MLIERHADGEFYSVAKPSVHLRTHKANPDCYTFGCVIHSPSSTFMNNWPYNWRTDRGIMERICKHGVGHPDINAAEFLERMGHGYANVHGCDGCCMPESDLYKRNEEIWRQQDAQAD